MFVKRVQIQTRGPHNYDDAKGVGTCVALSVRIFQTTRLIVRSEHASYKEVTYFLSR